MRLAALGIAGWAAPALAQAPTHYYCYVPDPASGTVFMSQPLPVGPVGERARYGSDYAAYLRSKGQVGAGAQGYCVMRWSEAAVEEARAMRPGDPCPECGGASRFVTVAWARPGAPKPAGKSQVTTADTAKADGSGASKPKRVSNAEAVKRANDAYVQSVKDAVRTSDPGVCLVQRDGSVRCTKGGVTTASAQSKPVAPKPIDGTQGGRADVCITRAVSSAAPQRCLNEKPKPKPGPVALPRPPKVGADTACTPNTVNIAVGRIGVAVSPPGTKLVLSQRLTNRTFSFGPGIHTLPTEVYAISAVGPTVDGQLPKACLSYDKKAPKPSKPNPPKTPPPAPESPSPPYDQTTQACTTLPRDRDTVIVIADQRIFVTMSPDTYLYMKDQFGNELKLGYGNHRVRPGVYKLGIYGVTDPFNPLKSSLSACVRYVPDF